MQDDKGRTYGKSESEKRAEAFDHGMLVLCDMHKRELNAATLRAYFEVFETMSAERVKEAFRRAIENERFFPPIAVLRAYAAGVLETSGRVVPEYKAPKYTKEQAEDIARMRADLDRKFAEAPWARGLTQ